MFIREGDFMANEDVKAKAKEQNVKLWEIAYKLGINDGNFSRKLRLELPSDEKKKILSIIHELSKGR